MQSSSDAEELRTQIWDWIYANGPKPLSEVSQHFQIAESTVIAVLDHSWFAIEDEVVTIATGE
ncbi:MAG: hypothetical protein R3C53_04155 [Pirellulaceae bacterium]